jgi:hypothetical protein
MPVAAATAARLPSTVYCSNAEEQPGVYVASCMAPGVYVAPCMARGVYVAPCMARGVYVASCMARGVYVASCMARAVWSRWAAHQRVAQSQRDKQTTATVSGTVAAQRIEKRHRRKRNGARITGRKDGRTKPSERKQRTTHAVQCSAGRILWTSAQHSLRQTCTVNRVALSSSHTMGCAAWVCAHESGAAVVAGLLNHPRPIFECRRVEEEAKINGISCSFCSTTVVHSTSTWQHCHSDYRPCCHCECLSSCGLAKRL